MSRYYVIYIQYVCFCVYINEKFTYRRNSFIIALAIVWKDQVHSKDVIYDTYNFYYLVHSLSGFWIQAWLQMLGF